MKNLRWQILVVLVTLLLVGILLLTQEPGSGPQVLIPQPVTGGVYSEALIGSISRLNPLLDMNNQPDRELDRLIFSSLIRFDAHGLPQPDLADSWGATQDGTIYNISIRSNAYWHDKQPVTSDDVIFTINLIKDPSSLFPQDVKELWSKIEIKRIDDKTLQMILPEPFAPFLDYLSFGILPQHVLGSIPADQLANSEFNLAPIGSGPYRFDKLIIKEQIAGVELVAFDDYYNGKPYIERAVFTLYPDTSSALKAYRRGDVLAVSQISLDVMNQALAEPGLSTYSGRLPELSMVMFNLNNPEVPFLQDAKLRRALLMGINRQKIIDRFLLGQGILARGPIFPNTWAYYDGLENVIYDPEGAAILLRNSEYTVPAGGNNIRVSKDGKSLQFKLIHPDDGLHSAVALMIQENWLQIGVKIELEALPYEKLVNERLAKRDYDAALVDMNLSRTPDPDPYPFWHQSEATGGQNYSQWDNRVASEYLEQARTTADFNVRARLYRNFQVIFAKDLPALPLYYPVYSYAVDQQVLGVQVPPLFDTSDRFLTFPQWYLLARRSSGQP